MNEPNRVAIEDQVMKTLLELGRLADAKLKSLGLRLTQGGEPTFVAADSSLPEWRTAALGQEKLAFARRLASRLIDQLLPGAAALLTTGKLYPGESHPRWRLALYQTPGPGPLWHNHDLLHLDPSIKPMLKADDSHRLLTVLADRLHLKATPLPAYEDVTEWMRLEESRGVPCPLPRFSRVQNRFVIPSAWTEKDQARWEPFCQPAGWVLPLLHERGRWSSPRWEWSRSQDLVLLTGESPLGLRLPLQQIRAPGLKCAVTAEIKSGELRLFLPPLPTVEAFRELLACLEDILSNHPFPPLTLEGYPPPREDKEKVTCLSLTADPGVLEVNLFPCSRFAELHAMVTTLYAAAHACGLRGFKYQANGRQTGTGGGAHVLLGGPSLEKNPFVLKPRLLPSFVRFTQNHPSLSYLFSGLFIGPSSQATRMDESIPGTLDELELALQSIEAMPSPASPDLIDRILRNLLNDWHGNPHRTEICVDKFSYPFNPDGRLGLVEFRAFEMVPNSNMLLAIHALIRALAASFAAHPYRTPFVEWGSALRCQFLLPHFLQEDFHQVLAHLDAEGFPFSWTQFQPQFEYRFPRLVDWELEGVCWEIRQALEPWPVMGNQPTPGGGTSRPVDASTDRLQLSRQCPAEVTPPDLLVNGFRIPFQPLQTVPGLALCGLRYRRFNNTQGLQPQVNAHTPLTFDLVDPGSHHILQSFHYVEPGLDNDLGTPLPVDEAEAKKRRFHAILPLPDRQGRPATFTDVTLSPRTPFTLDLRSALPC